MSAPKYNYQPPNYYEFEEFRNRNSRWKGVWITKQFSVRGRVKTIYECSICGAGFVGNGLFPTNFCPNCGADMKGE